MDWVLVSLKEKGAINQLVCTKAALLLSDGHVEFVEDQLDECCLVDPSRKYYIVVEHRNHLMAMSPEGLSITNGKVNFDFRNNQSYIKLFGSGQKEVAPGIFALYAANGDQFVTGESATDINSKDLNEWLKENGYHSGYYIMDFDLNGDVNVHDKAFFLENVGVFSDILRIRR